MPVATASVTPPNHQRFRSPNRNRSPRFSFSNTLYTLHAVVKGLVAEHVASDGSVAKARRTRQAGMVRVPAVGPDSGQKRPRQKAERSRAPSRAAKKEATAVSLGMPSRVTPSCRATTRALLIALLAALIASPRLGPEAEIVCHWPAYFRPSGDVCIPLGINPIHALSGLLSIPWSTRMMF